MPLVCQQQKLSVSLVHLQKYLKISSKHREMLDGEKVGHFLLIDQWCCGKGRSNLKYKVKS